VGLFYLPIFFIITKNKIIFLLVIIKIFLFSMKSNIKIFLLCPVPENQKPINEILNFQENFLTNWVFLSKKKYNEKSFSLFLFLLSFLGLTLFAFGKFDSFFSFCFWSFFSTLCLFFLFCFLLFFRWSQLENRLKDSRLFYEEGSWYDGQIWEKPLFLIKNERLLCSQKIHPVVQRISKTILILFYLLIFFFFLFQIF
jgi:hypothetical protein